MDLINKKEFTKNTKNTLRDYYKALKGLESKQRSYKPRYPRLWLPRVEKKYQNISNLLDGDMNPWEIQEIFKSIWETDNPSLIGAIKELFLVAKVCLEVDTGAANDSVRQAHKRYADQKEKYDNAMNEIKENKRKREEEYKQATDEVRKQWVSFIEDINSILKTNQNKLSMTENNVKLINKLIEFNMVKLKDGIVEWRNYKRILNSNIITVTEIMEYVKNSIIKAEKK